ncbi:hypothetical protein [Caballeronia sp. RCC_10]|uniref:hypothetical protein n=1 Tax=Caballeronia sp. RCC_10 TaxID=3239227 RepID=UPI00352463F0
MERTLAGSGYRGSEIAACPDGAARSGIKDGHRRSDCCSERARELEIATMCRHGPARRTNVEGHLEAVYEYFRDRSEGRLHYEPPEVLADSLGDQSAGPDRLCEPVLAHASASATNAEGSVATPVIEFYGRLQSLEALVAQTPGIGCGVQGVRIMRMVALMSKARSAQLANLRLSGTQAVYRHS